MPPDKPSNPNWSQWDETDYLAYLELERHLFAWCLIHYGSATPQLARENAEKRYPYEPSDAPYRGLIFHDISWHWAMLSIHGEGYWVQHRERQDPTAEYKAEEQRYRESHP